MKQYFVHAHSEKLGDLGMVVDAEDAGLALQEVANELDKEIVTIEGVGRKFLFEGVGRKFLCERETTLAALRQELASNMGSPRWAYELEEPVKFTTYINLLG